MTTGRLRVIETAVTRCGVFRRRNGRRRFGTGWRRRCRQRGDWLRPPGVGGMGRGGVASAIHVAGWCRHRRLGGAAPSDVLVGCSVLLDRRRPVAAGGAGRERLAVGRRRAAEEAASACLAASSSGGALRAAARCSAMARLPRPAFLRWLVPDGNRVGAVQSIASGSPFVDHAHASTGKPSSSATILRVG